MRAFALFVLTVTSLFTVPVYAELSAPAKTLAEARQARATAQHKRAEALAIEAAKGLSERELGYAKLLQGLSALSLEHWADAETALVEAEKHLPHLQDRLALYRGKALYRAGEFEASLEQFEVARRNATLELIAMQAALGKVRSMLAAGERFAVQKASQFLIRYPNLPERPLLEFEIAHALEKSGRQAAAYVRYRKLWQEHPQDVAGQRAGARLEAQKQAGVRVAPFRHTEHLERVRTLISDREFDLAEREAALALVSAKGTVQLHLQLELAIIAYRRGELDRARHLLLELQDRRGPTGPYLERVDIASGDTSSAVRRILKGVRPSRRTPAGRLVRVAEVHLDAGEYGKARSVLNHVPMARAPGFMAKWLPWIAFKTGQPEKAIPGFSRLKEQRWSRGRRRYWVGRAHHKAGNPCDARSAYEEAIRAAPHGYYGLWARQRLAELAREVTESRREQLEAAANEAGDESEDQVELPPMLCPAPTEEDPDATVEWTEPDPLMLWKLGPRRRSTPTDEEGLKAFNKLITVHGKSLPWLERARDLWLAGDEVGAGEELHQTLWASRGYLAPSVGLPRLWGGHPRLEKRHRRSKARFDDTQMTLYVRAAEAVGETGLAVRANRPDWGDYEGWHPLAFEPWVRTAAKNHGLEPELMWSVMRIESYFNRHAISHADALGLMQILPRTGRRVARRTASEEFQVADLLTPHRGLHFSAWYLRALSDRFHGQYPLMIAAYNGGPHNVASWISRRSDTEEPLPMDEFCEEIPFSETYRYVRRVLGSLAVYHALAGEPPPLLPTTVNRDVSEGVNF